MLYWNISSVRKDFLFRSGEKWHARRKLLTPSFHLSVLNNYFKTFNSQAVVSALGIQLNAQKGENEEFFYAVVRVFEMMFKTIRYPWLRLKFVWYGLGYGWEFDKNATILTTLTRKVFEEMETSPTFDEVSSRKRNRLSFLDLLISLRKEHNLSVEDICEEVGTIFVAGYDTTSSSMGYLLYLLGQHPEQQEKVYEEIVEVLGSDVNREIKMEDIKQLKYIDQCIKETLRLYPAVPMIGRLITEDLQVGDYTLPAGVTASVAPYSVQRDPKHWYDPEKFDPDRFAPENSIGRDPFAFIPFSAGMRNCLGQKFALMEEKVMLCRIIGNYQITTMTDDAENRGLPEITMKPERGFPLKFKLRR
uniref:Cytochrome P450 n=1 Tax=Syphacia muris TaxID=451379 RepID=A0A0N5B0C1_9BILA